MSATKYISKPAAVNNKQASLDNFLKKKQPEEKKNFTSLFDEDDDEDYEDDFRRFKPNKTQSPAVTSVSNKPSVNSSKAAMGDWNKPSLKTSPAKNDQMSCRDASSLELSKPSKPIATIKPQM